MDLDRILSWRNSERIRANMYTDHIIMPEEHHAWFERIRKEPIPACLVFEIGGTPVGVIHLNRFDQKNNLCHWGFYVGEPDAPPGSGKAMGFFGLEYIFETLNIRKLIGEAFAFNQASILYHQRLGFVEEGRFMRHILKNGRYEDIVSFALFREEWLRKKPGFAQEYFAGENER